ncbi:MAG: hypothetical protein ACLGSD_08580 [Acidobacteriota bacterium]
MNGGVHSCGYSAGYGHNWLICSAVSPQMRRYEAGATCERSEEMFAIESNRHRPSVGSIRAIFRAYDVAPPVHPSLWLDLHGLALTSQRVAHSSQLPIPSQH